MQRTRDRNGLVGALACLVVGGYVLFESQRFSLLGSVFPRAVALVLIAAAAALVLRVLLGREPPVEVTPGVHARRLALVGAALLWVFLLPRLGFVAASAVGFALAVAAASFERWTARRAAGYGLATLAIVVGFYLLFAQFLRVPLPRGTWLALLG